MPTRRALWDMGNLQFDKEARVTRTALITIEKAGTHAIDMNQNQLARFVEESENKEFTDLASRLLDNIR